MMSTRETIVLRLQLFDPFGLFGSSLVSLSSQFLSITQTHLSRLQVVFDAPGIVLRLLHFGVSFIDSFELLGFLFHQTTNFIAN